MKQMYRKMMVVAMAILFVLKVSAQSDTTLIHKEDKTKDKVKKGWNFGGLPVISYDSDLGLQLGA
ncbi:MAG: hypothetical protein DRI87_07455, partial [Bacteroidetes bacterium]